SPLFVASTAKPNGSFMWSSELLEGSGFKPTMQQVSGWGGVPLSLEVSPAELSLQLLRSPRPLSSCCGETPSFSSRTYYWYDEKGRKTKCTAPQYVDFVMSLCQKLVTDEEIFPTKYGKEFPNSFESLVKKICRYLFHVLAHLYWAHFKETVALDLQGHLNTLFAHFVVFVREFNLVDPKETCIMDDLSAPSPSSQNHVTER
uniref:MOB kinase activator 2a n=1 Tax=Oryzias sinensis TaxID=183150 RepID=A0A8C7XT84_9TELE